MNTNKYRAQDRNMVAGFSTTMKTKPLIIAKMEEYTREKLVKLRSNRLVDELFVYIYRNSKTEAMAGYNDDLVMSYAIALWIRDTALRIQKDKNQTQWMMMDSMLKNNGNKEQLSAGFQKGNPDHPNKNPYEMDNGKDKEDLTWLLG